MFDPERLQQEGRIPASPEEAQELDDQGYVKCRNLRCDYMASPETQNAAWSNGAAQAGYTCPNCSMSYGLLDPTPFGNTNNGNFAPGGGTIAGISMTDQGQVGEKLIQSLGQIPGYGPITWWSQDYKSPLDGATKEWGIEVKTIAIDATHHVFQPGQPKEKADKNEMARQMGLKGVLGILVIMDYSRSVADVYAQEFPFDAYRKVKGQMVSGVGFYRKHTAKHLVTEVPFDNPLLDPNNVQPEKYKIGPSEDDIPF